MEWKINLGWQLPIIQKYDKKGNEKWEEKNY